MVRELLLRLFEPRFCVILLGRMSCGLNVSFEDVIDTNQCLDVGKKRDNNLFLDHRLTIPGSE